ncbi:hypothetical protein GCM10009682_56550 [Luedemannella flava]|uniref:DUF2283 domain-containing protein n=1 Tax=Luedemannella flava TaxID=349316 RepID=A0ABP4YYH3_9ACTN
MYKEARIPLVCTYDSDADAAYIYLDFPVAPGGSARMVTFEDADGMFNLDLDSDNRVIGLEILGGSRLPAALLQAIFDNGDERIRPD